MSAVGESRRRNAQPSPNSYGSAITAPAGKLAKQFGDADRHFLNSWDERGLEAEPMRHAAGAGALMVVRLLPLA
jgi:hypothetical protein